MLPLTDAEILASFINTSKRETAAITLPQYLDEIRWDRIDVLAWTDAKNPRLGYAVVPLDAGPVGFQLRAPASRSNARAVCSWCEDLLLTSDVTMFVAKRAGTAGRNGNTLGVLLHADFSCSENVRRKPTRVEAGQDAAGRIQSRIHGLRARSQRFATHLRDAT